jgi:transcriptional regulator with GAF, ATPase, and Fis domain
MRRTADRERITAMAGQSQEQDCTQHEASVVRQLDEVTGALENLGQDLASQEELAVVLARLCRQALHAVPGAEAASVILRAGDDGLRTVAATHDLAHELDGVQHSVGQGPCLRAAQDGEVVRVHLAEEMERWPVFCAAASERGISSVLAAPLYIDSKYHGSLNLYGEKPHGYRELDKAVLELYTTAAEAALQAENRGLLARSHVDQLRDALTSRAVIDQAKGIIMAARLIDADAAFDVLVEDSQRRNRKLREVAEEFVTKASKPD